MSALAADIMIAAAMLLVAASAVVLFSRRRPSLNRVVAVMGIVIVADYAISWFVPWDLLWLPYMLIHAGAALLVLARPAGVTHAVIGSLYAVLVVVHVAYLMTGPNANAWSMYMDIINVFSLVQGGALLLGVCTNGGSSARSGGPSRVRRDRYIQTGSHFSDAGR